jgi:hypothetical protein
MTLEQIISDWLPTVLVLGFILYMIYTSPAQRDYDLKHRKQKNQ